MESREQSQSSQDLEKDVTLNPESAQEQTTDSAVNNPEATEIAPEVVNPVAAVEEEKPAQPVAPESEADGEVQPLPAKYADMTKTQLVEALEALKEQPIDGVKDDVAQIKAAFFAVRKEEIAKEKADFVAAGNEEAGGEQQDRDDPEGLDDFTVHDAYPRRSVF